MRIAWFRPTVPDETNPLDPTAAIIAALRTSHDVDVFTADTAHDFVWRHHRQPWDVPVYELGNSASHEFVWGYLLNYPGVTWLMSRTLHNSRAESLERRGLVPCYDEEFQFNEGRPPRREWRLEGHAGRGRYPMLRVPMLASTVVVTTEETAAATLGALCPEARVRRVPAAAVPHDPACQPAPTAEGPHELAIGTFDDDRGVVDRAVQRALATGTRCRLVVDRDPRVVLDRSDVIVALGWPPDDAPPTACLAAMAAGRPVVTFDIEATVAWPTFDPQAGRPRTAEGAPIAVTLDPRDEEHSLMLAVRRLGADPSLRLGMGRAAREWWAAHATPARATAAWEGVLAEARSATPPRGAGWPAHLSWDGSELARRICDEIGDSQG